MVSTVKVYLISVDSETGAYLYGNRELHSPAQINAVINRAVEERSGKANCHANREQNLIQFMAFYVIRRVRELRRIRSFRFM